MSENAIPAQSSTHLSAKLFKIAAVLEAMSWIGLLIGMFFKWIVESTERGVQIMGPIHGALFVAYLATCTWAAVVHKWPAKQFLVGLLSSIPPLMTLWFEKHAERTGLLRLR